MFSVDSHKKIVLITVKEPPVQFLEELRLLRLNDKFITSQFDLLSEARPYLHRSHPHILVIASETITQEMVNDMKEFKRSTPLPKSLFVHMGKVSDIRREKALELFRYGLDGFVVLNQKPQSFSLVIERVLSGERIIDNTVLGWLLETVRINDTSDLTPRELEVLRLLSAGKTSSEMADELCISRLTARAHIRNIYTKLRVSKKSEAIKVAKMERYIY